MTPRRALSYCLAALAFCLPLSIAGANASLAGVTLALIWLFATDRRAALSALGEAARSPVFLALAAYAGWALISSLAGLDPAASLRLWPKDLHKLLAFLAIGAALAAADGVPVMAPFALGLGVHALVGIGQAAGSWIGGAEQVRAHGFLHPVSYAEVLGLGLIAAAAYLARSAAPAGRRRAAVLLLALAAAALVVSQTRGALLAMGAAYAATCLLEVRWRRYALAAGLVLCGVIAFWEIMPTGGEHGRSLRNLISTDSKKSQHRSRLALWDVALRVARDHPITGVGPGRYRQVFVVYHPDTLAGEAAWGNAHNIYLHQLAERGVPGLIVLLAVFYAFLLGAWREERARHDAWTLCAAAATAAFLAMNLTETAWQTEQVATLFLFLWLLGAGPRPSREIL